MAWCLVVGATVPIAWCLVVGAMYGMVSSSRCYIWNVV